jgi:tRNA pseudouridine55 synthase
MTTEVSGLIPVWKPRGITSKDVSRVILKRFGKLKIGHVGTLDPDADGVLPVLIGRATKLQDYLLDLDKAYSFDLLLGSATDTLDATGKTVATAPWEHIRGETVKSVCQEFLGVIEQIPPLFSAVKYQGQELYKYARDKGNTPDIPLETLTRRVLIKSLTVDKIALPEISMTVHCGKGTYVRTLAADIAARLGTVGHVTRLTRIFSAGIDERKCVTIDQINDNNRTLESLVIPLKDLSIGLPEWTSDDMVLIRRITDGQRVILHSCAEGFPARNADHYEVLLKDGQGGCVGIVTVESQSGDQCKLHLKRGI